MSEKVAVALGNVQGTLLLPLWGRAVETQSRKPLLQDWTAVEIINQINYDFATIAQHINTISQFSWIARSLYIDGVIKQFLRKHPKTAIVNIGCGLDTTFDRIDNGELYWYELDLPDVIELRRKFIPEQDRREYITSSFLDDAWLNQLRSADNVLFIAAGVFYYFEAAQIRRFLIKLADAFPGSEIVFDATTPFGVKMANQKVIKESGMDEKSFLKWGLQNGKDLQAWDSRIQILAEQPMFKGLKSGLAFPKKVGALLADWLKIMSMVHLQF
jgi:O-methyltransferase involved in polyketide biosynthesis